MSFYITTDTGSDFPHEILNEMKDFAREPLPFTMDGVDFDGKTTTMSLPQFYTKLRAGGIPVTSRINDVSAKEFLESFLKQGNDVLHITLASTLSGTYESFEHAVQELKEEYPDRKLILIDSNAASGAQALLCYYAAQKRDAGESIEAVAQFVTDMIPKCCHYIAMNDLFYVYKGGRLTKSQAILGSIMKLKLVLCLDPNGKLNPFAKVITRKKSLEKLVECFESKITKDDFKAGRNILVIAHSDCEKEAQQLKQEVESRVSDARVFITDLGTIMGTHAGPDTMTFFFIGNDRNE